MLCISCRPGGMLECIRRGHQLKPKLNIAGCQKSEESTASDKAQHFRESDPCLWQLAVLKKVNLWSPLCHVLVHAS